MKKKNIFLWSMALISIVVPAMPATAQNNNEEVETISLPEGSTQLPDSTFKPQLSSEVTISSPILSTKWLNSNLFLYPASMLKHNPLMWNYNLNDTTKLPSRFFYIPFNQQVTYFGLGSYNNIGASLLWTPSNKLSLDVKAFISKQFGYVSPSRQILYGTGLMLNYAITDKLLFHAWGQYVTPNNNDPFLNMNNLFPKTNVGADLQYQTTQKTEVGVGIEYQYDKKTSTWKPEAGGKVKIGF